MPMTKSDVGREIARCAVGFLREHRNAWCVSVGNGETGRIEAIHMRNGGLDCPGGKGTYSYRIYTDDAGGFVLVPF